MGKPGVSLDLKRIQNLASNYLHVFDSSWNEKRDQIHPELLQMAAQKIISGIFKEQTHLCSRKNFLESRVPGSGMMALFGSKFSVSG